MQFTNFNIFTIFLFVIILGIIIFLSYRKYFIQKEFNKEYKLISSNSKFFFKYILLFISIFFVLFSIFGVKYGKNTKTLGVSGVDVMFVLDVSKSMNVSDINDGHYSYKRLDVAKKAIADYIAKHDNNRYGLVIFAGDAISTIPLTNDYDLFLTMLSGVDYRNLTVQGSDFQKALDLAVSRFIGDKDRGKALVFISDGGDNGDKISISSKLPKDIAYFVVGIGTEKGGKIIKGVDVFGRPIFQKYKGNYVISKLNTNNLKKLASLLNGEYFKIDNIDDLKKLDSKLSKLKQKAIERKDINELNNFSRILSIFSFIAFITFLIFYIFEENILKKFNN